MNFARIIEPGLMTTVQDQGRIGSSSLGVPPSGAADALSMRVATRLLGNADAVAALEFTLVGPTLAFTRDATICITGGACPAAMIHDGRTSRPLPSCMPTIVRAGEIIHIGSLATGARGYFAIDGGFAVPRVLDSRSTLITASIGGHLGRALRAKDEVPIASGTFDVPNVPGIRHVSRWLEDNLARRTLRVTPSLHKDLFDPYHLAAFTSTAFVVSDRSNRVGVRLGGPALAVPPEAAELASEGTATGAIQIPGDGQPIILGVDRPTTGGYPMIACVIAADVHIVGTIRPRDQIRFGMVTPEHARILYREQEDLLDTLLPRHRTLRPRHTIDINADIGEGVTPAACAIEAALIEIVTSVNIACGGHAGDEDSMRHALTLAKARGCAIGAHPSYPDREHFGRRRVRTAPDALLASLANQIAALSRLAEQIGVRLSHVKPHGSLYHDVSNEQYIARAIFDAARSCDPHLRLVGMAGSRALNWWRAWGAPVAAEAFADRAYEPDGRLRSRSLPGALMSSPECAARQALSIANRNQIESTNGSIIAVHAQTLCIHADTPNAVEIAQRVRHTLTTAGIEVGALDEPTTGSMA